MGSLIKFFEKDGSGEQQPDITEEQKTMQKITDIGQLAIGLREGRALLDDSTLKAERKEGNEYVYDEVFDIFVAPAGASMKDPAVQKELVNLCLAHCSAGHFVMPLNYDPTSHQIRHMLTQLVEDGVPASYYEPPVSV